MQPKEILKAIDPKGAMIEELERKIASLEYENTAIRNNLQDLQRHELERNWMRAHGIMLETTEGMKYLKEEDFDKFFKRVKITGKFDLFSSAPIKQEGTKVSYEVPPRTYDYELLDEETTNGTNTRKKGKGRSNQNP